ncbi:MAG: hypothetical protein EPN43_05455 [Jatrophihabitans sp.]|nr:MAG: hypothetical protein EPN43_05455 [Jatrophihabitans sp.]
MSRRGLLIAAAAVVVLAVVSTVVLAAAAGGPDHAYRPWSASARGAECTAPALPGAIVTVRLADMGQMMSRGGMSRDGWRSLRAGMMRVVASPASAPAGTVSLIAANTGYLTHELLVLPPRAGQQAGTRTVGADGRVDEAGSSGEASASCAAGAGDGIAAGSDGWVTVHLPAGRYELVCNLPGHYAAGMYTELDVT